MTDEERYQQELVWARVYAEKMQLSEAYDKILRSPYAGTEDALIATLGKEDIEEAFNVYHGPVIPGKNGKPITQGRELFKVKGSRGGYGLVKIIFTHGEQGAKRKPGFPIVSKEDVLSIPEKIREYYPSLKNKDQTRWRIPSINQDYVLVIAARHYDSTKKLTSPYLVTVFYDDNKLEVSKRREPSILNPFDDDKHPPKDTHQAISVFVPDGQNAGLFKDTMPVNYHFVKGGPMEVLRQVSELLGRGDDFDTMLSQDRGPEGIEDYYDKNTIIFCDDKALAEGLALTLGKPVMGFDSHEEMLKVIEKTKQERPDATIHVLLDSGQTLEVSGKNVRPSQPPFNSTEKKEGLTSYQDFKEKRGEEGLKKALESQLGFSKGQNKGQER